MSEEDLTGVEEQEEDVSLRYEATNTVPGVLRLHLMLRILALY